MLQDRSFTFILKTPPASVLLAKAAGVPKGSGNPKAQKVGKISQAQLKVCICCVMDVMAVLAIMYSVCGSDGVAGVVDRLYNATLCKAKLTRSSSAVDWPQRLHTCFCLLTYTSRQLNACCCQSEIRLGDDTKRLNVMMTA